MEQFVVVALLITKVVKIDCFELIMKNFDNLFLEETCKV